MAVDGILDAAGEDRATQVRIRLGTEDEEIRLPHDTGPILVSTELKRYELSTLVNRLLDTEKPVPLEFLINGQFLRTSLDQFLTQNGISAETTLRVEYVKALIPPLYVSSYLHDDWVSSVDVLSATSRAAQWGGERYDGTSQRILSGSYDGLLRMWDMSNEIVATGHGHTAPVKDAKLMSPTQVASSGVDRTVRIWKFTDGGPGDSGSLTPTLELYGHKASVDKLAVHDPSARILSASADHRIGIWTTTAAELPPAPEALLSIANKRRKLSSTKSIPQRGPLSLLEGHQSQVADVCFDERDRTVAYSCSWDHSVKTWDLTTGMCVDTRTTAQSLFSICHMEHNSLLATGTSARHITLIDPRASATTVAAMTLRGHTNAVVTLARDPNSTYQLLSGSHDGTCRIWDVRSVRNDVTERVGASVYVIERESARGKPQSASGDGIKVFGICWDSDVGILSAGEDKRIQINKGAR